MAEFAVGWTKPVCSSDACWMFNSLGEQAKQKTITIMSNKKLAHLVMVFFIIRIFKVLVYSLQGLAKDQLVAIFNFFDIREELPNRPFNPTAQGGRLQRALLTGSTHPDLDRLTIKRAKFDAAAMILGNIRIQLLNQSPHTFFRSMAMCMVKILKVHHHFTALLLFSIV